MADAVRARVASGRYASESEVIREGLRALADQERAVEAWLRGPVADAYDAVDDGSAELLTIEEVRASLDRDG
jgi:antitoxin ParD1/3/4